MKDPRKAKALQQPYCKKMKVIYLEKKIHLHIPEIERSKKQPLQVLRVIMRKTLPFEKALYLTKIDPNVEGDTITAKLNNQD